MNKDLKMYLLNYSKMKQLNCPTKISDDYILINFIQFSRFQNTGASINI